jgi:hypothetical protein
MDPRPLRIFVAEMITPI